ncbi:hypothetical protein ROSMUCSMR3_02919 [Roseovarius mucosus]|uniref:Uncharacterized protein n=1 Tax=Roseovarius mucosus TaxID=215743 RepID=A0A1V0RRR0_9RHOB|nr:hypothetical protein [Roseovarius mucosus]ARE84386.1 hypothetical protein ROSMUCSMR3_02919 [Roseovarius mucosus]
MTLSLELYYEPEASDLEEELGLEEGIPLSPYHSQYVDYSIENEFFNKYKATPEYEHDGDISEKEDEQEYISEFESEENLKDFDKEFLKICAEETDEEISYQIEQAKLRRLLGEHEKLQKIYGRYKSGASKDKLPSYHALVCRNQENKLFLQSPEQWITSGMSSSFRVEYPLAASLLDMSAKGIRLQSLKMMHLIYATAYHSRTQEIKISKNAIKQFFNTKLHKLKPVFVPDLLEKDVVIAATGVKNGSKPQTVRILESYSEDYNYLTFKLSKPVFEQMMNPGFYAFTDLLNVSRMTSVLSLGLLPYIMLKERSSSTAFTMTKNRAAVLMQACNVGEKIFNSKINECFNKALKALSECDYFEAKADINGFSKKSDSLRVLIRPLQSFYTYKRIAKETIKNASFQPVSSEYHVPGRKMRGILIDAGLKSQADSLDIIDNLNKNLIDFIYKNKISSGEQLSDLFGIFADNIIMNRRPPIMGDGYLKPAQEYFDNLLSIENEKKAGTAIDPMEIIYPRYTQRNL